MEREIHRKQLSDIAEELGWNLNTVKTRLKKGRNKISQMLNENYCDLINIYNDLR
jgi:DNA-directed RNA polymerase specialized sigma24 family protein